MAKIQFFGLSKAKITTWEKALWAQTSTLDKISIQLNCYCKLQLAKVVYNFCEGIYQPWIILRKTPFTSIIKINSMVSLWYGPCILMCKHDLWHAFYQILLPLERNRDLLGGGGGYWKGASVRIWEYPLPDLVDLTKPSLDLASAERD